MAGDPTDLLQPGLRVDGLAAPPDILQTGTITTMTTASAANATYACGWAMNAAGTSQHDGPAARDAVDPAAECRAARVGRGLQYGNVGSSILGEFLAAIRQVDTLV